MSGGALELDNPFWQFSLRVYSAPGVVDECLGLQNSHGINVNLLLLCAWLGAERRISLGPGDIQTFLGTTDDWQADVAGPLRVARRNLKEMPEMGHPEVAALRQEIASLELRAEQIEQALLFAAAGCISTNEASLGPAETARANIVTLLEAFEIDRDAIGASACPRLVAAAVAR